MALDVQPIQAAVASTTVAGDARPGPQTGPQPGAVQGGPAPGTSLPAGAVSGPALAAVVGRLNEHVRQVRPDLEFSISIDKETDRPVVKIIDRRTKEVVRQIPPQDILSLDHRLQQLAGLLLRARA